MFDITSGKRVPIDDGAVDMVTSSSVLEHLKNLEAAVTEVSRILKPGGKFINLFPSKFALFAVKPEAKTFCGYICFYAEKS